MKTVPPKASKSLRCDLCNKGKATVHITQDPMPGPVITIHLCERCSKKHGVHDPAGFGLADLLFVLKKKNN